MTQSYYCCYENIENKGMDIYLSQFIWIGLAVLIILFAFLIWLNIEDQDKEWCLYWVLSQAGNLSFRNYRYVSFDKLYQNIVFKVQYTSDKKVSICSSGWWFKIRRNYCCCYENIEAKETDMYSNKFKWIFWSVLIIISALIFWWINKALE